MNSAKEENSTSGSYIRVDFGDVAALTAWLAADWANWNERGRTNVSPVARNYSQELLLPQLVRIIEGSG
jgi:hypothetical protein